MLNFSKKQVKLVSLTVAMLFVLGVVGLAVSQSGKTSIASASSSSNVGVVDKQMLMQKHPDFAKAQETMQKEMEQAEKDYNAKIATMNNEQEKKDYYMQTQQRMEKLQEDLVQGILSKVDTGIKSVAEAKGLSVVVDKRVVVHGGVDITDDVMKKIAGK